MIIQQVGLIYKSGVLIVAAFRFKVRNYFYTLRIVLQTMVDIFTCDNAYFKKSTCPLFQGFGLLFAAKSFRQRLGSEYIHLSTSQFLVPRQTVLSLNPEFSTNIKTGSL